jgi:hypothetical protein
MKNPKWSIFISIAVLAVTASIGVVPLLASPSAPSMIVVPAVSSVANNGGTDFTVNVQVPNNSPVSGTFYDLQLAFVVQSISQGFTDPNGTVTAPTTLVTFTTKASGQYPGYPSRGALTSCSGIYEQRVDPRAYWGSNTAIYFLGLVGFSRGTWTITFVVTGLYYSNTITLTANTHLKVA